MILPMTESRLWLFLSTPSARRATKQPVFSNNRRIISIHALREEGDFFASTLFPEGVVFLSTPSARRATGWSLKSYSTSSDFYPRPPRGGRQKAGPRYRAPVYFYPRPPRGGRHRQHKGGKRDANFYPRPPRGGRRSRRHLVDFRRLISIHALREEGDSPTPRALPGKVEFLSTPSARRATRFSCSLYSACDISIHALREEGDNTWHRFLTSDLLFLSTPSARRATSQHRRFCNAQTISIHALREEGDGR